MDMPRKKPLKLMLFHYSNIKSFKRAFKFKIGEYPNILKVLKNN